MASSKSEDYFQQVRPWQDTMMSRLRRVLPAGQENCYKRLNNNLATTDQAQVSAAAKAKPILFLTPIS